MIQTRSLPGYLGNDRIDSCAADARVACPGPFPAKRLAQRGSESPAPNQPREQNELIVSDDRRTIEVTARVLKNMDQVRIVVDATVPDAESIEIPEPENE